MRRVLSTIRVVTHLVFAGQSSASSPATGQAVLNGFEETFFWEWHHESGHGAGILQSGEEGHMSPRLISKFNGTTTSVVEKIYTNWVFDSATDF